MSSGARPRPPGSATGKRRKRRRKPGYERPRLTLWVQIGIAAGGLPARSTLRRWAAAALERDARVTLRFVGEAEGRRLNQRFRGKGHATNVLTFVYDDDVHDASRDAPLAGDIVICVPVVRREAEAAGRPLRAHFAHLVVHGILHLQGYDHQRDREAATMERRETALLRRFRYRDPHAAARPSVERAASSRGTRDLPSSSKADPSPRSG